MCCYMTGLIFGSNEFGKKSIFQHVGCFSQMYEQENITHSVFYSFDNKTQWLVVFGCSELLLVNFINAILPTQFSFIA